MKFSKVILITGGAGFIGTHLVKHWVKKYPDQLVINLDLLTYAGNLENLIDIEESTNYKFIKGDIRDSAFLADLFSAYTIDAVIHLAAESHVDRSITDPQSFLETNILGTFQLLNACKEAWKDDKEGKLFYHVSTDEVFGSLGETGYFTEETAYDPRSPYSASKAASDHLVRAYFHTYHLPVVLSNCSNNYGPYQYPEKLIPLFATNLIDGLQVPLYGEGLNIRDWLHVDDHCNGIHLALTKGKTGEIYNIGGGTELNNLEMTRFILEYFGADWSDAVKSVEDRKAHDLRYSVDWRKAQDELGYEPQVQFRNGMATTLQWYRDNELWWRPLKESK